VDRGDRVAGEPGEVGEARRGRAGLVDAARGALFRFMARRRASEG